MMSLKQNTLKKIYTFEGKGLHTGKVSKLVLKPAPVDFGIKFKRVDLGEEAIIDVLADYVTSTARSTTISKEDVTVITIEHILSALTGLEVDNALIEINNIEVPILDGSSAPYVDAITKDGVLPQDKERKYIEIQEEILIEDENGAFLRISPADEPSYEIKIDFNSKVLGVQTAYWDRTIDYAKEIGKCRTFVFFHEIEFLFKNNLIKGGDVENAIVIVENPVAPEQLDQMSKLFNVPILERTENGYLSNLVLRFPNECGRHKLLDLIGDLRLVGGFLKAKVTAEKVGHRINTLGAKAVREQILKNR